jgi:gamma-glutamyltranspeptidase
MDNGMLKRADDQRKKDFVANVAITASMVVFVIVVFAVLLQHQAALAADDASAAAAQTDKTCPATSSSEACGAFGAVSTTHYLATQAAVGVLAAGGNAVDAAAAAQFMLGVVQPESTGLGGGAMFLVYMNGSNEIFAYDGREEAPADIAETAFCADPPACTVEVPYRPQRMTGGLAVGVPGVLAVTSRVVRELGTRSLFDLAAPAVATARGGFPMSAHLHYHLADNVERLALYVAGWFHCSCLCRHECLHASCSTYVRVCARTL